ncbi:hypothetical protein SBOR_2286 [Sclerotinia borealis F-4128]|uniref:Uncharacterized protein n=1 Tax=Sclerotinia borealis (strain F-4128) TaxID=1432307 RepID=W9CMT2_SCLBF|nr:hypothetical protein SBOR_2286 [Sclerotinia borealis F-4128]
MHPTSDLQPSTTHPQYSPPSLFPTPNHTHLHNSTLIIPTTSMDYNALSIKELLDRLSDLGIQKPTFKEGLIILLQYHSRHIHRQQQATELAAIERKILEGETELTVSHTQTDVMNIEGDMDHKDKNDNGKNSDALVSLKGQGEDKDDNESTNVRVGNDAIAVQLELSARNQIQNPNTDPDPHPDPKQDQNSNEPTNPLKRKLGEVRLRISQEEERKRMKLKFKILLSKTQTQTQTQVQLQ